MKRRNIVKRIFIIFVVVLVILLVYYLALPRGRIIEGEVYEVSEDSVEFLYDLTYEDSEGDVVYEQVIFDRIFKMIDDAENFVIVDMFLFGVGDEDEDDYRGLTEELVEHLVEKRGSDSSVSVYFITDDYNKIGKPQNDKYFSRLEEVGVEIIFTPLNEKSEVLNFFTRYFLKSWKKKLNHRKVVIADVDGEIVSLITSGNPHDKSSANSNVGLVVKEKIWKDIYEYEVNDAGIDDVRVERFLRGFEDNVSDSLKMVKVQYLADNGLMNSLADGIDDTSNGDVINMAMFYLSDKNVVGKLIDASNRGVDVNLILDTNDYFFAQKKFGIPNKPVAERLLKGSGGAIDIRWYKSQGEQFHTKLVIIESGDDGVVGSGGEVVVFLGSTNLAKNDIRLFNLQSDVKLIGSSDSRVIGEIRDYFDMMWENDGGIYTVDYSEYKSDSFFKKLRYEWEQFVRLLQ